MNRSETTKQGRADTAVMREITAFIDGTQRLSTTPERLPTANPFTEEPLVSIPRGSVDDVHSAVQAARSSFDSGDWPKMRLKDRAALIRSWTRLIEQNGDKLDRWDALEMGKPIGLTAFNTTSAVEYVRFCADAIDKVSGEVYASEAYSTIFQKKYARGVVGAIIPWNFPTFNFLFKAAPALATGNCLIIKPSELATQSALELALLAQQAGIPPGVLNMVPGAGPVVGKAIAEHPGVDMLTFTGSSATGAKILSYAGASSLKHTVAECGGKSPQIIFDDGLNVQAVGSAVASMIMSNSGQICSVGSRIVVEESAAKALTLAITEAMTRGVCGDPQNKDTTFGPLASRGQRDKVQSMVSAAVTAGASLASGGKSIGPGFFFEPTVVTDAARSASIIKEEIFGPVLTIQTFKTDEEAIALANESTYGLAAYVWTTRAERALSFSTRIRSGIVVVNSQTSGPFGSANACSVEPHGLSGVGIEGGLGGMENYLRRQSVWINHG